MNRFASGLGLVFLAGSWLAPAAAQEGRRLPARPEDGAGRRESYLGAQFLVVEFETTAEVVRGLLPEPLEPAAEPLGMAFLAHYPRTSFGSVYHEGAVFVLARHGAHEGWHCLAMPVDDRKAMFLGRRILGYPKEMARITLEQNEHEAGGTVVVDGDEMMRIRAKLGAEGTAPRVLTGRPHLNLFPLAASRVSSSEPQAILELTVHTQPHECRIAEEVELEIAASATFGTPAIPVSKIRRALWVVQDLGGPQSSIERIPLR